MSTTQDTPAGKPEPERYPRATIRLRYGRKMLRHGMALGWRTQWTGDPFPVTVTHRGDQDGAESPPIAA